MFSDAKRHTMERVAAAEVKVDPFPHIVVDRVFPDALYAEMQRRRLSDACLTPLVETGRVSGNYSDKRLCFIPEQVTRDVPAEADNIAFWNSFFEAYNDAEFMNSWIARFERQIRHRIESSPERFANVAKAYLGAEMFLMRDKENYVLGPHVDNFFKAVSVLFYMPPDERTVMLGTSLYTPKDKNMPIATAKHMFHKDFNLAATIPFRPNTLLAFPNVAGSIHGVEPVTGPGLERDLVLYDIKFAGL